MTRANARVLASASIALLLAGCGSLFPTAAVPKPSSDDYVIHVENGTTLELAIVVNGQPVGLVGAKNAGSFPQAVLPPLPWAVEARSASGRVVLTLDVAPGSVISQVNADGTGSYSGPGARADLSCGRLDVSAGSFPMHGPAPGPGVAGDCKP